MNKIKYLTLRLCVVTLCVTFINLPAFAAKTSASTGNDMYASLGNLCEYIGKIQVDDKGGKNACSFLPVASLSYDYFLSQSDFALSPQIGASFPKSGRDENINRMTLFALMNSKYKTSYVNLIAGLGLYFTRIWGPGGDEILNNGNSTDSFPLPKDPVYTRNMIVNLGMSVDLSQEISAELYTYIFNITTKEDRALSLGLNLSYHFGEVL